MKGKLIVVSGYSGAGKSTLISGTINNLPGVEYLHTVTTRPRRDSEEESFEYAFVSDSEYERRRSSAKLWDNVKYQGFKYGVDTDWVYQKLTSGTNLICAIAPDDSIFTKLKKLYGAEPVSIWIDTSKAISDNRIESDVIRSSRNETSDLKLQFQYVFKPGGIKQRDIQRFEQLVTNLLR